MMPFTNSIANGILLGFLTYVVIAVGCGKWKDLGLMLRMLLPYSLC